jgi:ectoine hydroxylase-related dioxygenase (phytanoyl-CoA dioxygenase family)
MNATLSPNPPTPSTRARSTITLTAEQIRSFHEDGFLALPAISTPEEVAQLRQIFDQLVEQKAGFKEGAQYDLVGKSGETGPPKLTQIISPVNYAPELRDTVFRANALSIAKQLLGPEAGAAFEHAIIKPAQLGAATPWHQDEAHRFDPNFDYNQISIWMPLQEATLENGCMQYIPGTNKGEILRHVSPGNDPTVHALQTDPATFDASKAVPCPLAPGGCTIHSGRTLHYAGPNTTGITRRAYILAFEVPPKLREQPREFPWNDEKQTDDQARKRAWRKRGGVLVEAARKLRNGFFSDPKRLAFEVKRAARALFK